MPKRLHRTHIFYRYTAAPGVKYDLILVFKQFHNTALVTEAEMYDVVDGHYVGVWNAHNMPHHIKHAMENWIEKNRGRFMNAK